jgi:hypothetical protein
MLANRLIVPSMSDLCRLIWCGLVGLFRSRAALEAEILVLRHQLNILRRKSAKRVALSSVDRLLLIGLYRLAPAVVDALKIIRPETLIRWHRAGFRSYWCWKSRPLGGRPRTPADIRRLIREMSVANPLWGAPRIHGELLKLGIGIGRTDHGRKVHGEETATAIAGLEDLPLQSCRRHRIDRSVPGPDDLVSAAVRIPDLAAPSS